MTGCDDLVHITYALTAEVRAVICPPCPTLRSAVEGESVVVATSPSPTGQLVPIEWAQSGLEQLLATGEVKVSLPLTRPSQLVCGSALFILPGAALIRTVPSRIQLNQPATPKGSMTLCQVTPTGSPRERFWHQIPIGLTNRSSHFVSPVLKLRPRPDYCKPLRKPPSAFIDALLIPGVALRELGV